jgi:hypothetical protein
MRLDSRPPDPRRARCDSSRAYERWDGRPPDGLAATRATAIRIVTVARDVELGQSGGLDVSKRRAAAPPEPRLRPEVVGAFVGAGPDWIGNLGDGLYGAVPTPSPRRSSSTTVASAARSAIADYGSEIDLLPLLERCRRWYAAETAGLTGQRSRDRRAVVHDVGRGRSGIWIAPARSRAVRRPPPSVLDGSGAPSVRSARPVRGSPATI